jgi:5S rRNA maturation endonuclease (ribonuclease M5)
MADVLTASDLAARVGARRSAKEWRVQCPAHPDQNPSLEFRDGDKGIVFCCRSQHCSVEAILSAWGLTPADVTRANGHTTREIVATYDYTDEHGALLYQVVRYRPKDFKQRRPDGAGGWLWNLGKLRRVLYRLPDLDHQRVVYIPEGEKDVDRLRTLGIPATTNARGASQWLAEYTQQLRAAGVQSVAVLPDHDDAGRAHAQDVARSCHGAGLKVKVIELPNLADKGDVSDWLDAGHTCEELTTLVRATPLWRPTATPTTSPTATSENTTHNARVIRLTPASEIRVRPVRWLWQDRIALGTLALLGGREGIGKTICAYTLTADITRGRLPGIYAGTAKAVIVVATEDSWQHTIVPRLMAAGADLDLVFRVDVTTTAGTETTLSLPRDFAELRSASTDAKAALVVLDPLLSRLDANLDTHKDAEVRIALEPLSALADSCGVCILGLIHVNKSTSTDVLTTLMASRAFAAVARSVLVVMQDPDDDQVRLLGQAKNNLGRMDLPTLSFRIVGTKVADTDEGEVWTGKLEWKGESSRTIREALQAVAEARGENRTAIGEAADWLHDYLASKGGSADSAEIKREGAKAGHSTDALKRARNKLEIASISVGFPRRTHWMLRQSEQSVGASPGETALTTPITLTTPTGSQSAQSARSAQSVGTPRATAVPEDARVIS